MKCLLLHDADTRYDDLLSEHDIKITNLPVLQTRVLDLGDSSDISTANHQGIIISSKYGVSFIVNNRIDVSGKVLAVVGPNTAKLIGEHAEKYHNVKIVWADNATALCNLILSSFPQNYSWIFYAGNQALDIIPKTLCQNDVKLKQVVVYKVEKQKDFDNKLSSLLDKDSFQAVVFFSPSGVGFTAGTLKDKLTKECVLVAFGKSTAAGISALFGDGYIIRICERPTPSGVLNVLQSL
ncbi:uncharacterized protein LOC134818789 [Bolinopsis microptera]|uniref:uncharacterized protein LOC134818789 n=1 Tax=Bolinopsis microptera TaxID=2820187 RepID=UPI00307A49FD